MGYPLWGQLPAVGTFGTAGDKLSFDSALKGGTVPKVPAAGALSRIVEQERSICPVVVAWRDVVERLRHPIDGVSYSPSGRRCLPPKGVPHPKVPMV